MSNKITLAFVCMAINVIAGVTLDWRAELTAPQPGRISLIRGDSVTLAADLYDRAVPFVPNGLSADFLWQTNGMGNAWWQTSATIKSNRVHVAWMPTMDVGANSYRAYFRIGNTSNSIYRAYALIAVAHGPGNPPNSLPLPTTSIDFALITVTNAPWLSNPTTTTDGSESILFGGENLVEMRDTKSGKTTTLSVYGVESNGESVAWPVSDGTLVTDKDLVATYGIPEAQMRVAGDNLSIEQFDGDTNIVIWSSSSSTSDEVAALRAECEALLARIKELESRPDLKSWGDYAPDGTPNPDPESLLLNRAITLLGSGFSWETSGTAAVLVQSGAVAFATGSDGEMRLGLDHATNYIAIVSGGMITVGARANSIETDPAKHLVTIDYDYAGSGDYPVVWYCTDLIQQNWQIAEGGTWTYVPGNNYATFNFSSEGMSRAFFKATTSVRGDNYFYSPLPAVLQGGVKLSAGTQDLIKFNSIVTIEKDGKTYKVIAEEIK